jgi:hypothetical protein
MAKLAAITTLSDAQFDAEIKQMGILFQEKESEENWLKYKYLIIDLNKY